MSLRDVDEARRYTERWMAYLQGDLVGSEGAEFERECLEDPQTCEELYRELNVDAALGTVRSDTTRSRPPRAAKLRRRLVGYALIGGLGLSGVAVAWWAGSGGAPSLSPEESHCRPVQPRGVQSDFPERFLWTRESGAQSYRFELRRRDSDAPYWETTVVDTLVFLPANRRPPAPRGSWSWRVVPQLGSSATARPSETAHFRIDGDPR